MEGQENLYEEIIHRVNSDGLDHVDEKIKKQKKILTSAIKNLRRLAMDKISGKVGEC